jgi:ABC-2 type transport system permease protein
MISAILRAQFLSMRVRGGSRRGGVIFSALTGLFFYGMWTFLAWGGMLFFSSADTVALFVPALSAGLLFVMLYWQLAPLISASFGASLDVQKLLAYPIPHGKLFLVEVLLRVATCAEMLIVVSGASIGLLRNPLFGLRVAPQIVAGALAFAVMNILLSAGTRNWVERIFLRTKFKEVALFVFVIAGLAPRILMMVKVPKAALMRFIPSESFWPWAAPARLMLGDPVALSVAICLAWVVAAFFFSRRQFERSIRYDAAVSRLSKPADSAKESKADGLAERLFRFPSRLFTDPVAALMEKELRTLARVPRFRLVYAMSCFFGLVFYLPNMKHARVDSFMTQNAIVLMSLYGLLMLGQITYWNCFGFDRSAVQGYFSWPIRLRDVLLAKNFTVMLLTVPQVLVVSLLASALKIPTSPEKIAEAVVVMFITTLYWLAMGNICSVRIPRALDPDKMNQMSNKMQALTILAAPFLLLPLVLAYWSRWFFESELVFAGLILVAAIAGAVFYWVGLDSAVNTANARRELLITELSRGDGPMSVT